MNYAKLPINGIVFKGITVLKKRRKLLEVRLEVAPPVIQSFAFLLFL